mmetsp:Transcript_15277/g.40294  ORF Transcript_15277/g.40294 Transcript_15277/m.40294 type:complete len:300 (+) Transcript_15277:1029-1928(+)
MPVLLTAAAAGVAPRHPAWPVAGGRDLGKPGLGRAIGLPSAAAAGLGVAHRQLRGAAVLVVIAAHCVHDGAASPLEAHAQEVGHTAAGRLRWAGGGGVALHRLRLGGLRAGAWCGAWCGSGIWAPLLGGVASCHSNATQTLLRRHTLLQADVALLAPLWAPGVLHDPVAHVGLRVCAIAHHQHTMVQLSAAGLISKHAAHVQLEGLLVSLDGHAHGLMRHGRLEGSLIVLWHILKAINGEGMLVQLDGLALAFRGGVGVVLLCVNAPVLHDELVGVVHEATPASLVFLRVAVHQLLLRC